MKLVALLLAIVLGPSIIFTAGTASACSVLDSNGAAAPPQSDLLFTTLIARAHCPNDVRELKAQFAMKGAQFAPALVANRGFHNSAAGSFSFFEKVVGVAAEGEVFFGHFTALEKDVVVLDQSPRRGKLMVELIAWDAKKGYYNFYELIGTSLTSAQWYYRGDTADILKDNRYLHLDPPPGENKFGTTLRCSACHVSGGPIMKELEAPHNDWWTSNRPLPMGQTSTEVNSWLTQLIDAKDFAAGVQAGILKLEASGSYQKLKSSRSLQEQLRPLFCDQEINLESDQQQDGDVQVPSAFFMNPLLGSVSLALPRAKYADLLERNHLRFPETDRRDADHAWLTPVKGFSDLIAIQTLVAKGVVTAEYAKKALEHDKTNPILSKSRCALLKTLPREIPSAGTANEETSEDAFAHLLRVRRGVFESEISQNPLGQILEPGFRVIFPEAH